MAPRPVVLETAASHLLLARSSYHNKNGISKAAIAGLVIALLSTIAMVAIVIWYSNKRKVLARKPGSVHSSDYEEMKINREENHEVKVNKIVRLFRTATSRKPEEFQRPPRIPSMIPETAITTISPQTPQIAYQAMAPLVAKSAAEQLRDPEEADDSDGKYWNANSIGNLRCMLEKAKMPYTKLPSPTLRKTASEQPLRSTAPWPIEAQQQRTVRHVRTSSGHISAQYMAVDQGRQSVVAPNDKQSRRTSLSIVTDLDWMQYDRSTVQQQR